MYYPILKAITNYQCGANFTSAEYFDKRIFMSVLSFGCLYSISIYVDHVEIKFLEKITNDHITQIEPINKPIELSVIYSLLKIYRKQLYDQLFSNYDNLYGIEYLKNNVDKIKYKDYCNFKVDIYLGIFALLNIPEKVNDSITSWTANLGGDLVTLEYNSSMSDLTLEPYGIDWAFMGRGLWYHLCKIKKD